jgi:hypothetical protein
VECPVVDVQGGDRSEAAILVRRDTAGFGQLRAVAVWIDNHDAGSLRAGEEVVFPVDPGTHSVQVKQDWMWSPALKVDVAPQEVVRLHCRTPPASLSVLADGFLKRHSYLALAPSHEPLPSGPSPVRQTTVRVLQVLFLIATLAAITPTLESAIGKSTARTVAGILITAASVGIMFAPSWKR